MKKQLKLFFFLAVITIGMFTFANSLLSLTASATYIEGVIDQDTIWTLIDSPFVVSKDITVNPSVTLTIEPGVEVRFGGNSSINVLGTLNASGTQDKIITFTSNKDQPQPGDWNSIEFSGTEPSILAYFFVKYAKNGARIDNSNVKIINSEIGSNLQNGITVKDGVVEIKNSVVSDNAQSGIFLTGNNQVTIQNNTIMANGDGIFITGNSVSGVDISQNTLLSNTQSGIKLDANNADYYNDIIILENILSTNNNGFYVSGNASTYITRNYVSYSNNTGIFYEAGNNHVAYFNDIYGNNLGMDVSPNASVTVDAEYNYWGNESGPYHISLNPTGKGNPVGGDGENLDFIFFLTAPIGYVNERPIARLLTDKSLVSANQKVMFIATTSSDDRRVDQYLFDFGDGINSSWTTLSVFVHNYSSVGTYYANLTVMDDFGVTSNNSPVMTINVQNLPLLEVSITLSSYTVGEGEQVSITAYVTNGTSTVEDANVTLFSVKGGSFSSSFGLTNSTGHFTTTFTAPNVTEINDIAIFATASKSVYADGSDYKYLRVQPTLSVQVIVEPTKIKSEETATVTVLVTHDEQPIADANVTVSSDSGSFLATTGITDLKGNVTFIFSAPQTTTLLNITIAVEATKTRYKEGQGQTTLAVEPKMLVVEVIAEPVILASEEASQVTVHVTHEGTPISNATVNISSDSGGSFSQITGTTDSNGSVISVFTAPQVNTLLNLTIIANATKIGYVSEENQATLTVEPKMLVVEVIAEPVILASEEASQVTVHVTHEGTPISNATVNISSDSGGSFSQITGTTDSNGNAAFVFTAPQVSTPLNFTITANAEKTGYVGVEGLTVINVTLETAAEAVGGLPLTIILMILIPVVIVAVFAVLIKLKVISVTLKERL